MDYRKWICSFLGCALIVIIGVESFGKPGVCPPTNSSSFNPTRGLGACVTSCSSDYDCEGLEKCCSNGCGTRCTKSLGCPRGLVKNLCPADLCQYTKCSTYPQAKCVINPCNACKAEFYDTKTWAKLDCGKGRSLCERLRDGPSSNSQLIVGQFTPQCESDGSFSQIQCMGSICFCVDKNDGTPNMDTKVPIHQTPKCTTLCQSAASNTDSGMFVPQCERDGSYSSVQCHSETKFCWCVDNNGVEWPGTRIKGNKPNCSSVCPSGVSAHDCDPILCSLAPHCHSIQGSVRRVNMCGKCRVEYFNIKQRKQIYCSSSCQKKQSYFFSTYNMKRQNKKGDHRQKDNNNQNKEKPKSLKVVYVPSCDIKGGYSSVQCAKGLGCWCVAINGTKIPKTFQPGKKNIHCPRDHWCPNGGRYHLCTINPCDSATCSLFPNATCKPNYCEPGCPAEFFDKKGKKVQCGLCPDGKKPHHCYFHPCHLPSGDAKCPAYPNSTCVANYCGGCNADFYDDYGNIVNPFCDLTECQRARAQALADSKNSSRTQLQNIGVYIPQCTSNGTYASVQCWGQTGRCWCVDKFGRKISKWTVNGMPNCTQSSQDYKPGNCPAVIPGQMGICQQGCKMDKDCGGDKKCCGNGCGFTCKDPVNQGPLCNKDKPALLCQHLCQYESCPAHPEANCTADSCNNCKIAFIKNGLRVNCTEGMKPCEVEKAKAQQLAMPGQFIPECVNGTGEYNSNQCSKASGSCWCVNSQGQEIKGTRSQSGRTLDCTNTQNKPVLTLCERQRQAALFLTSQDPSRPIFTPVCESNGSFKQDQCMGRLCFCVRQDGSEVPGTHVPKGQKPDCSIDCTIVKQCRIYCRFGLKEDCTKSCTCNFAPVKPGKCPPRSGENKICKCKVDGDCDGDMKCCGPDDCKMCVKPFRKEKDGVCPALSQIAVGTCLTECMSDDECNGNRKCCSNGCGRNCDMPIRKACPTNVPLVTCKENLCSRTRCPAFPDAVCHMNYCGECSAVFLDTYDNPVNCSRRPVCSPSETWSFCPDVCKTASCKRFPDAFCVQTMIGSCDGNCQNNKPVFINGAGKALECRTKCQIERDSTATGKRLAAPGTFVPRCDPDGSYSQVQCNPSTRQCWCVNKYDGNKWEGSEVKGKPNCEKQKDSKVEKMKVGFSFESEFDYIKDDLKSFKTLLIKMLSSKFGLKPSQITNLKVTAGSIVIEFVLANAEGGNDINNITQQIEKEVRANNMVMSYGGMVLVAEPDSLVVEPHYDDPEPEPEKTTNTNHVGMTIGIVLLVLVLIGLAIGGAYVLYKRNKLPGFSYQKHETEMSNKDGVLSFSNPNH